MPLCRILTVGFLAVLGCAASLPAQTLSDASIPEAGSPDDVSPQPNQPSGANSPPGRREIVYGDFIDGGTVIVRGEVLPSPYKVGQRGRDVLINDVVVARLPGSRDEHGRDRPDRSRVSPKQFVANIETRLYNGDVLVCFDDRTRVFFYEDDPYFLQALARPKTSKNEFLPHSITQPEEMTMEDRLEFPPRNGELRWPISSRLKACSSISKTQASSKRTKTIHQKTTRRISVVTRHAGCTR